MGSDDTGTAKTLAQRQAMRRQAPYAQRRIRSQRSSSIADNIMSICEQLSKPLFGRSLSSPCNQDAFSVPWRTVDRETMELRQQLEQSEESSAEKSEPVSPYESVFETARKIASVRAQEQDNSPPVVSKGKEPEVVDFEDDDEEDDEDFVPSDEAKDDDEEEELERQLEPIDESEEVIEPSKPSTASYETESSPQEQSAEEDLEVSVEQSAEEDLEVSVVADDNESEAAEPDDIEEASESEIVEPDEVEEASESEIVEPDEVEEASESEVAASEEEQAELSSEDEVQVSIEESESEESDQATEELASIASAESVSLGEESEVDENTQPIPESPVEPADAVEPELPAGSIDGTEPETPVQSNIVQQTPTSRKWWPFSGSSLLGSLLSTEQRKGKRSLQESESESPVVSPTFGQRRALPKHSSGRLFVPSSFIDVAKETPADSGKSARVSERSTLKRNALLENRRHTMVLPTQPTPVSSATVSTDTISTSPKRFNRNQSTPLITAASLGLEGRRNAARGYSGQQQRQHRRRTCLYYGSGYGSSSTPYVFDTMRNALADTGRRNSAAHAPADQEVASNVATEVSGVRSSTTAQRILDIIGDVPPTRSQAGLDSQGTANPYELSSPYSVRMQLKSTQRRRVLVPLSTRLSQPAEPKSSSEQRNSKAILESIQSAAPPEIQAKLGSVSALAAKKPSPELPKMPQFKATSARSKPAVDMTPPPPTQAQISTPATSAAVMKPAAAMPTPTKASALNAKQFLFTLPPPSTPDSGLHKAVKSRVASLSVAELPTFVFTLGEQQSGSAAAKPAAAAAASAAPAAEWTCGLCDLKSPDSASKCVVCDADRPVPKPAAASKPAPAAVSGKEWECSVCELKSPATAEKCIVCDSPKPAGSIAASVPKPTPATSAVQEWECSVCELKNPPSAKDCTVCDAPKPAASSAAPKPAGSTTASVPKTAPATTSAAQEWECKVCELKNPQSAKDCTVCDAPRPEQTVATAAPPQSFAALAKAPKASGNEWTCELCDLKSPESASKCIVCDAPKPGSKPAVAAPQSKPTPSFAFGLDVTKTPAVPAAWASSKLSVPPSQGQWECAVCELKNQASDVKCTVCDADRPAATSTAAVQPAPAAAAAAAAAASKQTASASLPVFEFDLDVSRKPLPPQQLS
ncbi:hypothetical protein EV183_001310 [Coemansia sp. RSA 2336]|nr:hypothetical protein EV183_001310 [Coemansia sp. RSA 2336]